MYSIDSNTISLKTLLLLLPLLGILTACYKEEAKSDKKTLKGFQKMESVYSGIDFQNSFIETAQFNFITYPYIYGGAGVAVGDINNDGLSDIYLISNYGTDKLYLNKGDFKFEDITTSAGVTTNSGWKTGVSMADVNADGWLDIYVSRSGPIPNADLRRNLLFINQKNGTFVEQAAQWGLDFEGYSTQAYFFDFDKDGDLDIFAGNLGKNNKFNPKGGQDFHIYCNDFDANGSFDIVLSKESNGLLLPVRGRECSSQQVPDISTNFETYSAFSDADIMGIYGKEQVEAAKHLTVQNFGTTLFLNNGSGDFEQKSIPPIAQTGPTLDAVIQDFNQNGHLDILGIGAIHQAEAETIRYDGNKGYLLLGDGKGNFNAASISGLNLLDNSRTIESIMIGNEHFLVVSNNDNYLSIRKINH